MAGDTGGRLVSRETEMEALRSALDRAKAGHAATVLVAGDAGVGKSRLVAELAAEAGAGGVTVAVGHCVELGESELPYGPFAGALRALTAQLDPDALDEVLGAAREDLARLLPDLAAAPPGGATAPGIAAARLFELILGVLGRAAARTPVLAVIEDLHWADGSTRDLLRFLVRSATTERLALVVTYRLDDLHQAHPLHPYIAELGRDPRVSRIALGPLTRAAFADHVAAVLGSLPSASALDRLFERSEGNPFFTEELLAAGDPSGPLPTSMRDAMLMHLERLSPPTQRVVRVLAAAGRRVDYGLLAAAADMADGELADALREAVAAHVLVPAAGSTYEFRHALLREVAYGELVPGERETLHATLASALEARPHPAAAELAHHWHAAGDLDRAVSASVRAGEEAARAYAHPEALRHFERALELWEHAPPTLDRAEITAAAAAAAGAAGEHDRAIALGEHALELVDAAAEPLRGAVLRARLAQWLYTAGRGDEARVRSAEAAAMIPARPTPERARVLAAHARLLLLGTRIEEARAPIAEAIAIARELELRVLEADALTTSVIAEHGRTAEAIAAGEAALRAARDAGDPVVLVRAHINAAEALDQAGRLEAAIDLARAGIEVARRAGTERVLGAHLRADVAQRLVKLGRYDEAQAQIADALRAAPSGATAAALHGNAALIAAQRGDTMTTERAVRLAREQGADAGGGMWTIDAVAAVTLALWSDEPERAAASVDDARRRLADAEFLLYSARLYALGAWAHADLALRARARRRENDAAAARSVIVALRDRFDALAPASPPPEVGAYRAQIDAELGRLDEPPDAEAWASVRERWERLSFRFAAAVCAWREAEARITAGDTGRAAELLGDAYRDAQALGARPLAEQIEALAKRARVILGEPSEGPPAVDTMDLTPRELEVLGLVVEGWTNREIGSALFISEKTVSVHVSNILTKLGATNRAQAATLAHRLGLP